MNSAATSLAGLAVAGLTITAVPTAQAGLVFSGDDLTADTTGVMTITSQDSGGNTLWQMDVDGGERSGNVIQFRNFTDGGGFNYASVGSWSASFWEIEANALGTFQELEKSSDRYSFSITNSGDTFEEVTTYTLNTADATGTQWTAERTITNVSGADATPPHNGMGFGLSLNVGPYTADGANAILDGTSGMADRYHRNGSDASDQYLYRVNENVDRSAGNLDTAGVLEGKATVLDNAYTAALGMTPGLEFHVWSDIIAYYPADSIGEAGISSGERERQNYLFIEADPREWTGSQRDDFGRHDVPLAPGESMTRNFGLDMNIAVPEPASATVVVAGLGCLLARRRRARSGR